MNYRILPATLIDLLDVLKNLRDSDKIGLKAFSNYPDDPDRWAAFTLLHSQSIFAMRDELGRIHGIAGFNELRRGVLYVWAVGTKLLDGESAKRGVDFLRRVFDEILEQTGVHRIECMVLQDFTAGHRTIKRLGFESEGLHRGVGANGENIINYARSKP